MVIQQSTNGECAPTAAFARSARNATSGSTVWCSHSCVCPIGQKRSLTTESDSSKPIHESSSITEREYHEAYWKIDGHNLPHFLELRMDSQAALDVCIYANFIARLIQAIALPLTGGLPALSSGCDCAEFAGDRGNQASPAFGFFWAEAVDEPRERS